MLIRENLQAESWILGAKQYYMVRPTAYQKFVVEHSISRFIWLPFILGATIASVMWFYTYTPEVNSFAAFVASVTGATTVALIAHKLYHRHRTQILASPWIVELDHEKKGQQSRFCSGDYRWRSLRNICSAEEFAHLVETEEGNALLDTFLCTYPPEIGWHPEMDRDELFYDASSVVLQVRQRINLPS